jgi:integrase
MRKVEFYFLLDRTFIKGTDIVYVKRRRKAGKNIDTSYNPNPTSIYIGCSVNSVYVKVNTGWKIKPAEWDFNQQEPSRKYKNHLELKGFLHKVMLKVERDYLILLTNDSLIDAKIIRAIIERAVSGDRASAPNKISFWSAYEEFIAEKAKVTKGSTILKYNSTKAALEGFEKKYYVLSFDNMDMQFYRDFKLYSAEVLLHLNNTISKNLRNIKTLLAWAEIHPKKYLTNTDYKRFKGDNDEPEPIYLNESELQRFENFNAGERSSQQKSQDIFLFQCYTGQRIGDVLNVRKQDIRLIENGPAKEWVLYQQKGNKKHPIYIPILDTAEEILNRYCKDINDGDLIFPGQSTAMLNKNIKKIAKDAKIDTVITKVNYCGKKRIQVTKPKYNFIGSHTARKTFISLSLQWGMRPEQLKSITGHTSVKQMNPYIGNDKNKLMTDLKNKWNRNGTEHSNESRETKSTLPSDNQ